jgi:uncharacterized protein DUF4255
MAGYRALAAVGKSIVELLTRRFADDPTVLDPPPEVVLAGTADFDRSSPVDSPAAKPCVSVFCYKVCVDAETRPGWHTVSSRDGIPRIPFRMHLLITAWAGNAEQELSWLGLVARVLESEPSLTGPVLHPSGGWEPGDSVQVVCDDIPLEPLSEAFQALAEKYRLSLAYVARVVVIDGRRRPPAEPVTTVAVATGQT